MDILKRLPEVLASPVGIMGILLATGFLMAIIRRQSRLGRRLLLTGAGLGLVYVFTPLPEILIAGMERPYPPLLNPDANAGIRATVVLSEYGADYQGIPATSKLSTETLCRTAEGIRLYRLMPGTKLLLSGGILRDGDPPVAGMMADYAKEMGVPENDIVIEGRSLTTYENLVEVRKILGGSPFLLVTSASHLRRAMAVSRRLGMNPVAAPACIRVVPQFPTGMSCQQWFGKVLERLGRPSTQRLAYLQTAYHEYLGYLWYWALGRV